MLHMVSKINLRLKEFVTTGGRDSGMSARLVRLTRPPDQTACPVSAPTRPAGRPYDSTARLGCPTQPPDTVTIAVRYGHTTRPLKPMVAQLDRLTRSTDRCLRRLRLSGLFTIQAVYSILWSFTWEILHVSAFHMDSYNTQLYIPFRARAAQMSIDYRFRKLGSRHLIGRFLWSTGCYGLYTTICTTQSYSPPSEKWKPARMFAVRYRAVTCCIGEHPTRPPARNDRLTRSPGRPIRLYDPTSRPGHPTRPPDSFGSTRPPTDACGVCAHYRSFLYSRCITLYVHASMYILCPSQGSR